MNAKILIVTAATLVFSSFVFAAGDDGPADVCKKLVDAAKKDDFATVEKLSLGESHGKKAAGKFHKMHDEHMARLKDTTCGGELTAEDHAVVQAESEGKKRLIPFVKEADGWKFDARTYMTFYFAGKGPGAKAPEGKPAEKK